MLKKLILSTTFCVLSIISINAQITSSGFQVKAGRGTQAFADMLKNTRGNIDGVDLSTVQGSQYIEKEFQQGNIFYSGKKTSQDYFLRYNAFKDIIEINTNGGQEDFVLQNKKISVTVGNNTYDYVSINKKEQGYMRQIAKKGDNILYVRHVKTFSPAVKAKTSFHQDKKAAFKDKISYYISQGKSKPKRVKKLKQFYQFSEAKKSKKEAKKFIKENKIKNFDNEAHLKSFFNFMF